MRGFLGILAVVLVALVAGTIGFGAGVAANAGGAVSAGTAIAPGYVYWWGFPHFGGLLFGFLFLIFVIGLISFAVRGPRRARWDRGWYRGYWGYGPTHGPADPRHQWMADAHRRLHEEEARGAQDAGASTGPGPSNAASSGSVPPGSVPPGPPPNV